MTSKHDSNALIERLRLAQEIVERSDLQPELRPAAFTEVYRALGGEQHDSAHRDDGDAARYESRRTGNLSGLSQRLTDVAEALKIDASVVTKVFADDNDGVIIVAAPRRFAKSTRGALKQVAILFACARQAGGWDQAWTTAATIRGECTRVGFDTKNLGAVLDSLDMFAGQGSAATRQLRAHDESYKAAREVLVELEMMQPDV